MGFQHLGFDRNTDSTTVWDELQSTTQNYDADGNVIDERRYTELGSDDPETWEFDRTFSTWTPDGLQASSLVVAPADLEDPVPTGGLATAYGYDPAGNPTSVTDPRGRVERNLFSADDLLTASYIPTGFSTGTPPSVATNPYPARRTTYAYDALGRKAAQDVDEVTTDPGGPNPSADTVTANGAAQTFVYNDDGSVRTETGRTGSGETIEHRWHANGAQYSATDATATDDVTTTTHQYLNGWPLAVITTSSDTGYDAYQTAYAYHGDGTERLRLTRSADTLVDQVREASGINDAGLPTRYAATDYDAHNIMANPRIFLWERGYDNAGRQIREHQGELDFNNGPVTYEVRNQAQWDRATDGMVKTKTVYTPATTNNVAGSWSYTYDRLDRQLTQVSQAEGENANFAYRYDSYGRMDQVTNGTTAEIVGYDENGNRTSYQGVDYRYNDDNTIHDLTDGTITLNPSYDTYGRVDNDGCRNHDYDGFDRLTAVSFDPLADGCGTGRSADDNATYTYDGLDRQHTRTQDAETTDILYTGTGQTISAERSADPHDTTRYFTSPEGRSQGSMHDGDFQYLHDDGHGNIALATSDEEDDTSQGDNVECAIRYDPWGNTRPDDANTIEDDAQGTPCEQDLSTSAPGETSSDVLFRDSRRDVSTGNYQWGSRTYNPDAASWLQPDVHRATSGTQDLSVGVDPLTRNRYSYVNGDPINYYDPSGHEPCPKTGCTGDERRPSKPVSSVKYRGQREGLPAGWAVSSSSKISGGGGVFDAARAFASGHAEGVFGGVRGLGEGMFNALPQVRLYSRTQALIESGPRGLWDDQWTDLEGLWQSHPLTGSWSRIRRVLDGYEEGGVNGGLHAYGQNTGGDTVAALVAVAETRGLGGQTQSRVAGPAAPAPRAAIGFADDAVGSAYQGMRSGGGHAMRHLMDEGLVPNSGNLGSRAAAFQDLTSPILRNPSATFNWQLGGTATRAFAGHTGGSQVVGFLAKEGPYQGRVISAVAPDANQVAQWGL